MPGILLVLSLSGTVGADMHLATLGGSIGVSSMHVHIAIVLI